MTLAAHDKCPPTLAEQRTLEAPCNIFKHQPLATDRDQIRLVRFLSYWETIELEVSGFDLNDHIPDFNALSYMWGPEQPSHTIQLNGQPFVIRDNLHTFFQTLVPKRFGTDNFLWIDQICIDQTSISERNAQVALMADIYSKASRVITWLNPSQSSNPSVLDEAMSNMQSLSDTTNVTIRYVHWKSSRQFLLLADFISAAKTHRTLPRRKQQVIADIILSNLYWTRVWIVQELLLAGKIDVFFGYHCFSWESVESLCDLYSVQGAAAASASAIRAIKYNKNIITIGISYLVWSFRNNECHDPRDKIFGFLGVVRLWQGPVSADAVTALGSTSTPPFGITVDYARPVHAVLLEAVPIITTELVNEYPPQTQAQRVSAIIRATEDAFYLCRAMIPKLFAEDDFVCSIRVTYVVNLERLLQLHHNVSLAMLEGKEGQWIAGQVQEVIEDPISFGKRVRLLEANDLKVHKEIIKAEFARLQPLLT